MPLALSIGRRPVRVEVDPDVPNFVFTIDELLD
jgi:hypothetical protein